MSTAVSKPSRKGWGDGSLVDAATLGQALGMSRETIYDLAASGAIPCFRIGNGPRPRIRFDLDEVRASTAASNEPGEPNHAAKRQGPQKPTNRPPGGWRVKRPTDRPPGGWRV